MVLSINRKPCPFFHGTALDFDQFDAVLQEHYFSSSKQVAGQYAQARGGDRVIEVFLEARNSLVIDAHGERWDDIRFTPRLRKLAAQVERRIQPHEDGRIDIGLLAYMAKALKYDSLVVRNVDDGPEMDGTADELSTVAVVFEAHQIIYPEHLQAALDRQRLKGDLSRGQSCDR